MARNWTKFKNKTWKPLIHAMVARWLELLEKATIKSEI